jgi:hypothetical protein
MPNISRLAVENPRLKLPLVALWPLLVMDAVVSNRFSSAKWNRLAITKPPGLACDLDGATIIETNTISKVQKRFIEFLHIFMDFIGIFCRVLNANDEKLPNVVMTAYWRKVKEWVKT